MITPQPDGVRGRALQPATDIADKKRAGAPTPAKHRWSICNFYGPGF